MLTMLSQIIARHSEREGPLLPILLDVQAEYGYISEDSQRFIASALNLGTAEVRGVVSFYHDLRQARAPLRCIKLCRAEACQARGGMHLFAYAETIARGQVVIEPVYCLGLCSVGPAAIANGTVHGRLDTDRLAVLIESSA